MEWPSTEASIHPWATEWEDRDWAAHATIRSGDLAGDAGPGFSNDQENSCGVFYHPDGTDLDRIAMLDGLAITDGNADGEWPHHMGGRVYNHGSSP